LPSPSFIHASKGERKEVLKKRSGKHLRRRRERRER
jgi:hypothetical protein